MIPDREGRSKSLSPHPAENGAGSSVRKKRKQTRNSPARALKERIFMAKDGTARGGQRFGQGRPSKAIKEKIDTGNPGGRKLQIMDLPEPPDMEGREAPDPRDYMLEKQQSGIDLCAADVFKETWEWLASLGCEKLVSRQLIDQYAMSVARWIQCEHAISRYSMLSKHPTSGKPIASPFVTMSQNYMKQTNQLWYQIYQVVKENCLTDYNGADVQDDVMERLLRARKGL
jgi:hypothetical protein